MAEHNFSETELTTIAQTLAESRASHTAYRFALQQYRGGDAKGYLRKAAELRRDANALDPDHAAPAWENEAKTHDDAALTVFYANQMARG